MKKEVFILKEFNRMCQSNNCMDCPLSDNNIDFTDFNAEKATEDILKWSKENPNK